MISDNEKRLVGLFRQFMDKCVVPTIKNYGAVMNDWQGFNTILSQDPVDYMRLQSFLEGKSNTVKMFPSYPLKKDDDKQKTNSGFLRKKEDFATPESPIPDPPGAYTTFSSNKTFGGDRARMNMFPLPMKPPGAVGTTITPIIERKEENTSKFSSSGVSKILTNIEALYKTLSDNQQRF